MSMQSVTKAGEYTDKVLTDNFTSIAKAFKSVDNRMDMFDNGLRHLNGHVGELFQMAEATAKAAAKTKSSSRIKPFLVGAAIGVVVYRYARNNPHKVDQIKQQAQEQIEEFKQQAQEQIEEFKRNQASATEGMKKPGPTV